jgi:hypothetical protein
MVVFSTCLKVKIKEVVKEAYAKRMPLPTQKSDENIHSLRDEPEQRFVPLRDVIGNIVI